MKRRIRLSENDLHRVIKESVNKALSESVYENVPWSEEDTPEGQEMDWQLYQSNPYGNIGGENMNIQDRGGELAMDALSDVPDLQALGRSGATTLGQHIDAQQQFMKDHNGGDFFPNSPRNKALQQAADVERRRKETSDQRKMKLNTDRMMDQADKRPLHRKGSLNAESRLHKIVSEAVKKCLNEADDYGWYVDDNDPDKAYYFAIENGGWDEESLNAAIVGCMSKEEKAKCLAFLFRMDDFRAWKDQEMYDE